MYHAHAKADLLKLLNHGSTDASRRALEQQTIRRLYDLSMMPGLTAWLDNDGKKEYRRVAEEQSVMSRIIIWLIG